ncbi:hypothetical protein ATCV1_z855R [Acanthocystis turfacea chlorella virus 1]|uniref:Uncharacterized protein z855R n=1 Tax=Chlorovirus heliozoae TaxID=322019 RepID=A7KAB5_9PHYC|nr:hypothetical protein ATCV1_z855R [Acanthocystis turfacea chlorella virus 1]ABT16989.1 hypothetical protein ATCV1_z855R [Acanthocystis turfacea chlorella virus 1]
MVTVSGDFPRHIPFCHLSPASQMPIKALSTEHMYLISKALKATTANHEHVLQNPRRRRAYHRGHGHRDAE